LGRELAHPREHAVDVVQRTFAGLRERDAVLRVAARDRPGGDFRAQALADAQTRGVVGGRRDAQAGGQVGVVRLQLHRDLRQVLLRDQR
jgi:hypothetical protein